MTRNLKYSDEQLQKSFEDWCTGTIGKHTMSRKEWAALKRRLNLRGFKKQASHFHLTTKVAPAILKKRRQEYMRKYRQRQKELREQEEAAAEEPDSDAEELEEARQALNNGEYVVLV
jgi:hypothetical protein